MRPRGTRALRIDELILPSFFQFRPPEGGRYMISCDATARRGAASETRALADRRALRRLLVEHFGFDLSGADRAHVPTVAGRS
jgi:hypothetical protein